MKEMDLFLYMFSILATQAVGMLICTGFFAWSAEKKRHFYRKQVVSVCLYGFMILFLSIISFQLYHVLWEWMWNGGFRFQVYVTETIILKLLLSSMIFLLFRYMFQILPSQLLYCEIAGYAGFSASSMVYKMIRTYLNIGSVCERFQIGGLSEWGLFFAVYGLCFLCLYFLFAKRFHGFSNQYDSALNRYTALFCLLIAGVGIVCETVADIYGSENEVMTICFGFTQFFFNIIILFVQCFLLNWAEIRQEKDVMERIHIMENNQYKLTKENMDIINIKCHDIKQQLCGIAKKHMVDEEFFQDVNKAVEMYDSVIKTGLDSLDVILTDKAFRCKTKGITLTAMIRGEALKFISVSDINSLFGNALDNAIEYVEQLTNKDNKFIAISCTIQGNLICIRIENYYMGELMTGRDGLPVTNKTDKVYHGYGVRSMKQIVEKYGGTISFKAEDNLFKVTILLEIKNV